MRQLFSRPDPCVTCCGHLDCAVHEHRIAGAPAFMRGLRALFVSDTHVRPRTTPGDIEKLVGRIRALAPDILLLGGDYADRAEDAARLFGALGALRPPLGCFGVPGNNDAEAWPDMEGLRRAMADAGMALLVNASTDVPLHGGRLIVAGVDERKFGSPRAKGLYPEEPLQGVYRVLLAHYPCMPDALPDLMLSGHTHGGQFNLLGITPFTIGFERLFRRDMLSIAVAGLHEMGGGAKLLVSKGVGASRLQLRVGVRPEIDLITFE